jgi:hypothetical protein
VNVVEESADEPEAPAPPGAVWRDVLDDYATTLEAQRVYLDAVARGTTDVEPPAPFAIPTGLPTSPADVRAVIESLHAATVSLFALHADLPDRLERPQVGSAIARRSTSGTPSVLDRAL